MRELGLVLIVGAGEADEAVGGAGYGVGVDVGRIDIGLLTLLNLPNLGLGDGLAGAEEDGGSLEERKLYDISLGVEVDGFDQFLLEGDRVELKTDLARVVTDVQDNWYRGDGFTLCLSLLTAGFTGDDVFGFELDNTRSGDCELPNFELEFGSELGEGIKLGKGLRRVFGTRGCGYVDIDHLSIDCGFVHLGVHCGCRALNVDCD